MVICNIVYEKMDDIISQYKDIGFVNLVDKHWKIKNNVPTLIYGYKFAQNLFPDGVNIKAKSDLFKINRNLYWSYTESELSSQQWSDAFITNSLTQHLYCYSNNIDVIFDNNWNFNHFVNKLSDYPLIHVGKYEIYVGDLNDNESVIIHSFQMDNLRYANLDPENFFYRIINTLEGKCVMLSTEEIDLTRTKVIPISFQDLMMAKYNKSISLTEVLELIKKYVSPTKEMLLTYFLKHELYSKTLFKSFL